MSAAAPKNTSRTTTTKARLNLGLNLSLHKLPVVVAVVVVFVVVGLFIWLATGANTAGPLQSGASSAQANGWTPGETNQTGETGAEGSTQEPSPATPINLNTADVATLEQLPGIGEVRARAIVNYRNANGPFLAIEDILNVKGIGPETFEQIKGSIEV